MLESTQVVTARAVLHLHVPSFTGRHSTGRNDTRCAAHAVDIQVRKQLLRIIGYKR